MNKVLVNMSAMWVIAYLYIVKKNCILEKKTDDGIKK